MDKMSGTYVIGIDPAGSDPSYAVATVRDGQIVSITASGKGFTEPPQIVLAGSGPQKYEASPELRRLLDKELPDVPLAERGFGI